MKIKTYNSFLNENIANKLKVSKIINKQKFDIVIVLGSINFGSTDKIFAELEKAVSLCAPGAVMFFRVNPGIQHDLPEARWITFYPWNSNFIINCADYFNVDVLDLRKKDTNNRMYFVWRTK